MSSVVESPVPSSDLKAVTSNSAVPLWRLYTLRLSYLILAGGIGTFFWPSVIHHTNEFAMAEGVRFSLLGGLGLVAVLGLRYPVQMIPLLLFELTWKAIYIIFFALPLWQAHQITDAVAEDVKSIAMVVIFLPLIPWGHVFKHYVLKPGERWK